MKTLLLSLALANLAASAIFLAPAAMVTGTVLMATVVFGGRDADYADEA
jgi:hypothetical protein